MYFYIATIDRVVTLKYEINMKWYKGMLLTSILLLQHAQIMCLEQRRFKKAYIMEVPFGKFIREAKQS